MYFYPILGLFWKLKLIEIDSLCGNCLGKLLDSVWQLGKLSKRNENE